MNLRTTPRSLINGVTLTLTKRVTLTLVSAKLLLPTLTKLLHRAFSKPARLLRAGTYRDLAIIEEFLMQNVVEFSRPKDKMNWNTLTAVVLFHIAAVVALFTFSWSNLLAAFILWWIAGSLGIGIGYHRLLTHRGFTVPKWLEYVLSVC